MQDKSSDKRYKEEWRNSEFDEENLITDYKNSEKLDKKKLFDWGGGFCRCGRRNPPFCCRCGYCIYCCRCGCC